MSEAVYVLVQGRLPLVQAMVARKTPPHVRDELVNNIFGDVFMAASRSFAGGHVGEFVNFVKTITQRRIADFVRDQKRQVKTDPIGGDGDEESWGPEPVGPGGEPGPEVWVPEAVAKVMATRSETHRRVIEMRLRGARSKEVIEEIDGMSVANVDKILSRFRRDMAEELDL